MLHKAWNSKEEMPYCFPRSSIRFQGHRGQNITDFDPNSAFPDYRPVAAFKSLRFALLKVIRQISRSHGRKIADFDPNWAFRDSNLSLNLTDGFEVRHKAWCTIEEVPYHFSRSSIKFQGHTGWKIYDLNPIWVRLLGRLQLSNRSDLPCLQVYSATLAWVPI